MLKVFLLLPNLTLSARIFEIYLAEATGDNPVENVNSLFKAHHNHCSVSTSIYRGPGADTC